MSEPIRLFLGTEPKTRVMARVLSYSIQRHTKAQVDITFMEGKRWLQPWDIKTGTGFSLRRFMIPRECGYQGRAIYLDADQLVFGDIATLWSWPDKLPRKGCSAWLTYQEDKIFKKPVPQTSVMVIDCAAAQAQWEPHQLFGWVRDGTVSYQELMRGLWLQPPPMQIPTEWNHLDKYTRGETQLLHYTKEDQQPPVHPTHPYAHLWQQYLREAIMTGVVDRTEFERALQSWGRRDDWRRTNGLHPYYKQYLRHFPRAEGRARG